MTRTYIIEIPEDQIEAFEGVREYPEAGKIIAYADNFDAKRMIINAHTPANFGTWGKDGKFRGSTNYSGEAVRSVLTVEPK